MGGGLIQIVSYGSQDEYLSGEPDITFFKILYKKHVNFAMETIEQEVNVNGNIATCVLRRDGDLILNCWIQCEDGNDSNYRTGNEMVEKIDFLIGGQVIDTHYGAWYDIWSKLSMHRKNIDGYNEMINKSRSRKTAYVPMQFFFCKNHGLALPLIALKYHEVSFNITFKDNVINPRVFADYVYLEQDDRVKFAQMKHEILIEQLQYSGQPNHNDNGNKYLNLTHPVKELIWKYSGNAEDAPSSDDADALLNYNESKIGTKMSIKLNEFFKIKDREDMYFTHIQPYQHHTNIPPADEGIYVYSFSLQPEDYQPSGTCNFSRLKSSQILSETGRGIEVYAINYNVLTITSGMGGLMFSM